MFHKTSRNFGVTCKSLEKCQTFSKYIWFKKNLAVVKREVKIYLFPFQSWHIALASFLSHLASNLAVYSGRQQGLYLAKVTCCAKQNRHLD